MLLPELAKRFLFALPVPLVACSSRSFLSSVSFSDRDPGVGGDLCEVTGSRVDSRPPVGGVPGSLTRFGNSIGKPNGAS